MNQSSNLKVALQAAVISGFLAAGLVAIPAVQANIRMNGTAGTLCKASSGPGASVFYFSNLYAENTSAGVQYLTCAFPDITPSDATAPTSLEIGFQNPTASEVSYTCVIQSGWLQTSYVVNSAVITKAAPANSTGTGNIYVTGASTPAMPARQSTFSPYSVSCSIPAAGRLSLLTAVFPGTIT